MRNTRSSIRSRTVAAVLVATTLWCVLDPAAAEQVSASPSQSALDVAKLYDSVVDTVAQKFFDTGRLKEVGWQERAAAMRPSVLDAPTTSGAVRRINALLAELKTSHTALFTPDDYEYYVLLDIVGVGGSDFVTRRFWGSGVFFPGTGAFTREIKARHFVDGVLEGSPADRAGIKYGDEIISVDGGPYSPIAAFSDKLGRTVEITIRRRPDGEASRLLVPVVPIRPVKAFADAIEASARVIERNGVRIGYVHLWALAESNAFQTALARFDPAKAMSAELARRYRVELNLQEGTANGRQAAKPPDRLIVDMRGRVGGNIGVANQVLELLNSGRTSSSERASYWGNWETNLRGDDRSIRDAPRRPSFRGRSALLIDAHTRSAGEIMSYGFKHGGFGPLLGTPTAGAVSSGALYAMPGDLLLYVAVAGHTFDGNTLEGVGVAPDIRIERPLPYAAGADPVLDAALELLAGKDGEPRPE